ncbi:MAG: hypothetical protein ABIT07_09905 [Ferruginibacter sp.]
MGCKANRARAKEKIGDKVFPWRSVSASVPQRADDEGLQDGSGNRSTTKVVAHSRKKGNIIMCCLQPPIGFIYFLFFNYLFYK